MQALAKTALEFDYDFRILNSVMAVNEDQKKILSQRIINYFNGDVKGKTIAIWGLAFKPNTDDIREAPALTIIDDLLDAGAHIKVFDPEAAANVERLYGDKIIFCDTQYEAIDQADALAIVTEWQVFRTPDFDKIKEFLINPAIFDGRNVYDTDRMRKMGFYYESIGRP